MLSAETHNLAARDAHDREHVHTGMESDSRGEVSEWYLYLARRCKHVRHDMTIPSPHWCYRSRKAAVMLADGLLCRYSRLPVASNGRVLMAVPFGNMDRCISNGARQHERDARHLPATTPVWILRYSVV